MEQLRGLSQEGNWWIVRDGTRTVCCTVGSVENSESTVASSIAASATTAKLATTTAESATKSHPSLVRFTTVSCADSGIGSVGRSKSSTNQSDLGGYERFGKASTVEEHGE